MRYLIFLIVSNRVLTLVVTNRRGNMSEAIKKINVPTATTVLMASALLFAVMTGGYYNSYNAYAQNNGSNSNNNNLDVQVTKPSSELTAQWWQWASSFPRDENPLADTTGEDCSKGDISGNIFFLAGSEGGKVERDCTVAEGQAILIPIVTTLCFKSEPEETQESLLAQCTEIVNQQKNLKLIIDGNKVQNLESYRVTNPSFFTVEFPENNIFEPTPAGSYDAVADGYWVLIEGLSAGEHDITVVGKLHGQSSFGKIDFRTQVTYHLTVE
jgi:hypothetical protein